MDGSTDILIAAGAVLAVVLERAPRIKDWMDRLPSKQKQILVVAILFVLSMGVYGLSCFTQLSALGCPDGTFLSFVVDLVLGLAASQGVHLLTKRPNKELVSSEA